MFDWRLILILLFKNKKWTLTNNFDGAFKHTEKDAAGALQHTEKDKEHWYFPSFTCLMSNILL